MMSVLVTSGAELAGTEVSTLDDVLVMLSVITDEFFMEGPAAEGMTREDKKRRGLTSQLYPLKLVYLVKQLRAPTP